MNELKPCPFCGGESLLRDLHINGVAYISYYKIGLKKINTSEVITK